MSDWLASDILIQTQAVAVLAYHIKYIRFLRVWRNSQRVVCQPSAGVVVVIAVSAVLYFQRAGIQYINSSVGKQVRKRFVAVPIFSIFLIFLFSKITLEYPVVTPEGT